MIQLSLGSTNLRHHMSNTVKLLINAPGIY